MKKQQETVPFSKDLAKVILENIEKKPRYFGDHVLSGRPIWNELILTPHSGIVSCKEIKATVKQLFELGLICKVWHRGCRVLEVVKSDMSIQEQIDSALDYQQALEAEEQDFRTSLELKLHQWKKESYIAEGLTEEEIADRENREADKEDWKKRMTDAVKAQIEKSKKDYQAKKLKYQKEGLTEEQIEDSIIAIQETQYDDSGKILEIKTSFPKGYTRAGDFHYQDLNPVQSTPLEARVERDLSEIIEKHQANEKSLKKVDRLASIGILIGSIIMSLGLGFIIGYFI